MRGVAYGSVFLQIENALRFFSFLRFWAKIRKTQVLDDAQCRWLGAGMKIKTFKPSFHFIYGVIIGVLLCALVGQTNSQKPRYRWDGGKQYEMNYTTGKWTEVKPDSTGSAPPTSQPVQTPTKVVDVRIVGVKGLTGIPVRIEGQSDTINVKVK